MNPQLIDQPKTYRVYVVCVVIVPLLAVILALWWGWNRQVTWHDLAALLVLYAITGFSITAGFHRLFAHRSYQTVPLIRYTLAACGSMAAQGFLFQWVAEHRLHHRFADRAGDPHSPHTEVGLLRGFIHAHVGWLFRLRSGSPIALVPDLAADPGLALIERTWWVWILVGLAIPAVVGWWFGGNVAAFHCLVWGGFVRIFLLHHVTWSINSICHIWGSRPFQTGDSSGNVPIFGLLAVGEGWHNNHHAFPSSARHGLKDGEFDPTWYLIRTLERFGLAWDVRLPAPHQVEVRFSAQQTI